MVDHGVVVGPARGAARRRVQRLDQEDYRRRGHRAQLVWLRFSADAGRDCQPGEDARGPETRPRVVRSEEHTSELQSRPHLVCRLLLEKKKTILCVKHIMNIIPEE